MKKGNLNILEVNILKVVYKNILKLYQSTISPKSQMQAHK